MGDPATINALKDLTKAVNRAAAATEHANKLFIEAARSARGLDAILVPKKEEDV